MTNTFHRIASVFLALLMVATIPVPALAETLHYWRFENSPGFLVDSAGSADLAGSAQQALLPEVGRGGAFPNYLSVPAGGDNAATAEFFGGGLLTALIVPAVDDFTIEAFVHLDTAVDQYGINVVSTFGYPATPPNGAWSLQVRLDGWAGTQERELLLALSDASTWQGVGSGFVLNTGVDYYAAAAFDLEGHSVTFYLQDLTNGGPLQSSTRSHSIDALNPITQLAIGGNTDGFNADVLDLDGLIDEVRISDAVLREDELLVSNTAVEPLEGLISWWPLDGNAIDSSGNGNNGQIFGAVPCEDRFGNTNGAMCFDNALGQYINIGNQVQPPFPFTITAWVKPVDTIAPQEIIRNDYWGTYYYGAKVQSQNGRLVARYGDGGYTAPWSRRGVYTAEAVMVAEGWQHLAVVFNAHRDIRLYWNCAEQQAVATDGYGGSIRYRGSNGALGRVYTGAIDDVRVYDRALSSVEIAGICQESGPGWFGDAIQLRSSNAFSLQQGTQETDSLRVRNPGDVSRSATLDIINPHPELGLTLQSEDAISIAPGETVEVPLTIDATSAVVGVYDGILLTVAVDDGSTVTANITVYVTEPGVPNLPELTLNADDIRATTNGDGTVTVKADVCNLGLSAASAVDVELDAFGVFLDSAQINEVPAKGCESASFTVQMGDSGDHLVQVVIDPFKKIQELNKDNNEASKIVQPGGPSGPTAGNILVRGDLPSRVCADSLFSVAGQAVYDITVGGVRDTSYPVKGGAVKITADWATLYGDTHTDVNGDFSRFLLAPTSPGFSSVSMTVTDTTFSGTGRFVFEVEECPVEQFPGGPLWPIPPHPPIDDDIDWEYVLNQILHLWQWICSGDNCDQVPAQDVYVYSEGIAFSNNHPDPEQQITIGAQIQYFATEPTLPSGEVQVNVYATAPGSPRAVLPRRVIDGISAGGSRNAFTTWKAPSDGIYIIEAEAVPTELVENTLNNAATRAIIVGEYESGQGASSGQVRSNAGGVGGVPVHISDAKGTIGSTVTDATGFYLIEHVSADDYEVQIDVPTGYVTDVEAKAAHVADQSVATVDFLLTKQAADATPPLITLAVSGTLGNDDWYRTDVTVSWSVVDNESPISSKSGCDTTTVTTDTTGETFTCSATSGGGTASQSVTVQRDATPPTTSASVSPAVNGNGWNDTPVTVSFTCNDATSGVLNCPSAQTLDEGASQSASGTATDKAGNSATTQVTGINVDLTPPVVSVTGVTNGALYTLGAVPGSGCTTTDALSGVETNATLSVTGGNGDGTGTFTASCSGALDKAGNTGAASLTYQVNAPVVGDLDGDGDIDTDDYNTFRGSLGKCDGDSGYLSEADYDGDGCVTYADYRIWYGYYRSQ